MDSFSLPIQIRWSDIDANRHLRHSVYYDYGAWCRMEMLSKIGLTTSKLEELEIGPVLFREEGIFRREIRFEDKIKITARLLKSTKDYARWAISHTLLKEDGTLAASVHVEGAWIDTTKRKLAVPNEFVQKVFEGIPKAEDFEWIILEPSKNS